MFRFKIPQNKDSILDLHHEEKNQTFDPDHELGYKEIEILVWNVYKAKRGRAFLKDFVELTKEKNFLLIQEMITSENMLSLLKNDLNNFFWKMAASFQYRNKQQTGVMTGAFVPHHESHFVRSQQRELGVLTPKVTLKSEFKISKIDDLNLMIVNTHAINFTSTSAFVSFIRDAVSLIGEHQGPLIFAGDFNTWNKFRWVELVQIFSILGLKEVKFHRDPRKLKLDHIFVRGLTVKDAEILSDIQSSDHFPLKIRLSLK